MAGRSTLNIHDGAQPRVLIVEDNPVNALAVKTILERDKIRCVTVDTGEDALDELRRSNFDLILLDIELPAMSGYDVLKALRERQSALAFLPIVLLTGRTDQQSRLEGLDAGATDFLTKPFDPAELGARIRNHIGAKRLYDKLMLTNYLLEEERGKIFQAQLALLPSAMPARPGLRFGAGYQASSLASGDYYDVVERPDGRIILAVADVSGHGIASAMHMSIMRSTLRSRASQGRTIHEIMVDLNSILRHALDDYSFVTFYLAEFDPFTSILRQVSAGHHAPLLHRLANGEVQELPIETVCPLGLDDEIDPVETSVTLGEGSRLVIYTDGLIEQVGPSGDFFDVEGVRRSLAESSAVSPQAAVDRLIRDLNAFSGVARSTDDVTVLIMDVTGTSLTPK